MQSTGHRVLTVVLVLAGLSMVVGDLVLTPSGGASWNELGLGLLFLGLMSVSAELNQRVDVLSAPAVPAQRPAPEEPARRRRPSSATRRIPVAHR
ncbi:hypothetical protein [Saccharopolyspora cebuensis]|uniref:Uncharacterized protein n=1 Tax=Saccharopolyspora cebuensis TaxID=418759 RepID=A0ABV4CHJ9_9PSEU